MTQKELAEKMGVKEQQVQRDEANQYSSAGFQRITAVTEALNIKIQETHILKYIDLLSVSFEFFKETLDEEHLSEDD